MKIAFFDTKVTEGHRIVLVEEKTVDYSAEIFDVPNLIVDMINHVTHLNEKGEEHCYLIAMDIKNRVLGMFFISKGTKNQSLVGGREIFMRALMVGASFIILCHNHPSGDCFPSKEDIILTKKFKDAGDLIGVTLSDHIIIGGDTYFSFLEHELL